MQRFRVIINRQEWTTRGMDGSTLVVRVPVGPLGEMHIHLVGPFDDPVVVATGKPGFMQDLYVHDMLAMDTELQRDVAAITGLRIPNHDKPTLTTVGGSWKHVWIPSFELGTVTNWPRPWRIGAALPLLLQQQSVFASIGSKVPRGLALLIRNYSSLPHMRLSLSATGEKDEHTIRLGEALRMGVAQQNRAFAPVHASLQPFVFFKTRGQVQVCSRFRAKQPALLVLPGSSVASGVTDLLQALRATSLRASMTFCYLTISQRAAVGLALAIPEEEHIIVAVPPRQPSLGFSRWRVLPATNVDRNRKVWGIIQGSVDEDATICKMATAYVINATTSDFLRTLPAI